MNQLQDFVAESVFQIGYRSIPFELESAVCDERRRSGLAEESHAYRLTDARQYRRILASIFMSSHLCKPAFTMALLLFVGGRAIAQRDCHGALRVLLADDVLVQFTNNLARSQFVQRQLFFFSRGW